MEELKVKNAVISKQAENSSNFEEFLEIANRKKINIITVNKGDKLNIEDNIYFQILWPDKSNFMTENKLNNNSVVCKLHFKDFSCLFTGDIEEIAEEKILEKYKNNLEVLNSDILKVAHHRFKNI